MPIRENPHKQQLLYHEMILLGWIGHIDELRLSEFSTFATLYQRISEVFTK